MSKPSDMTAYPFSLPIFENGLALELNSPITILVGENGSGKSTLLEGVAAHCGFNLGGGSKSHFYKSRQDASPLAKHLKLSWQPKVSDGFFLRSESFYQFADYVDDMADSAGSKAYRPYGNKSLNEQSHGEAYISMFLNRFGKRGIYLLDEPEAALSPQRQLSLIKILFDLVNEKNSQVIMATHSPMLMSIPGADVLMIEGGDISHCHYKKTPHFSLTKRFLSDPDSFLSSLLETD